MNEQAPSCQCDHAGPCPRYGRAMSPRMHAICRGDDIGPVQAAQYRQLWLDQKDIVRQKKTGVSALDCPHRGEELVDAKGEHKTRDCQGCKGRVRLKLFPCKHPAREPEEVTLGDCRDCPYRPRDRSQVRWLILKNSLSPGDVVAMTAAVYSLHKQHQGQFATALETTAPSIWDHNPHVVPLEEARARDAEVVDLKYPAIHQSNERAIHFMQACCEGLEDKLGVRVPLLTNRPRIYLSRREKSWLNQVEQVKGFKGKWWLLNAGIKADFTAKFYPWFQEVVDRLQGSVVFVQIGKNEHLHRPLRGVINLLGLTDDRQLIRLVHHAQGVVCGTTFLMHLAAAFEKPAVVLAGGREPRAWNSYPRQALLSTVGQLSCCARASCWKSRVVALGDGAEQDGSLCEKPAFTDPPSPKCLASIEPKVVADAVLAYYAGGVLVP